MRALSYANRCASSSFELSGLSAMRCKQTAQADDCALLVSVNDGRAAASAWSGLGVYVQFRQEEHRSAFFCTTLPLNLPSPP